MSTTDRTVRPASADDLEPMIELARRSWLSAFAQTAPFALIAWWAAEDRTRKLYEATWRDMFVLVDAGAIAGILQPTIDEINGLWIHPARQGHGFGAWLLGEGERMVRDAGHGVAWLTCSAFNPNALRFYARQGYVETARTREVHRSGVEIEEIRMERRIGRT
jgi:ribosomal-protein-alanine N-acetyltransferase